MIDVSEEAESFIGALIEEHGQEASGIRIYVAGEGSSGPQFGIGFQQEKWEGDIEDQFEKFSLFYDEQTNGLLDGALIDYAETPEGPMLIVQRPEGDEDR